jgi:hypothetical protein
VAGIVKIIVKITILKHPRFFSGPGRMLSDFDPQMEYRYQTAAILHEPYSPF